MVGLRDLWRWRDGRQGGGYKKMLLAANPFLVPFDVYVLRFRPGVVVPRHTDPVDGKRHYRVNIVLRQAKEGGEFVCDEAIINRSWIKFSDPTSRRTA